MSERVTVTDCPRCGGLAAIGWAPVEDSRGGEVPVEFDCSAGCQVDLDVLARAYRRGDLRPPPDSPAPDGQMPG